MKKTAFTSEVKQYWNKPLRQLNVKAEDGTVSKNKLKVLPVAGDYDAYESYEEVLAAGETPSKADVLKWKNARLLAAAKAKASLAAITAAGFVEPTPENDPTLQLQGFYDMYYANIKSRNPGMAEAEIVAQARAKAATESGIAWPKEEGEEEEEVTE